jgi:hypothetical protein
MRLLEKDQQINLKLYIFSDVKLNCESDSIPRKNLTF